MVWFNLVRDFFCCLTVEQCERERELLEVVLRPMFFVRRSMLNSAEQCTPILRACCIFQLCFDPAVPYQPGDCVNLEQNLYQGEERYQNQFSTITFDYIGGRSVCYSSIAQVVRETKAAGILGTDLECHFPAKDLVRLSRA